jgi:hypothetical protein
VAMPDVVGVWWLVAFHDVDEAGARSEGPLGADPKGILVYTGDGHVSVNMMRTGAVDNPSPRDYMGYAGTWRWSDGRIRHRILVTPRRDWIGTEQVRDATLDGDLLTLHATAVDNGRHQDRVLIWQRVPA